MLTLGSGIIQVSYWKSGAVKGTGTSSYFGGEAQYTGSNLVTIGEIGGDVEFDINFQEREFLGQYNFAIAKAFFGGKVEVRARRVELNLAALKNLFNQNSTATTPVGVDNGGSAFSFDVTTNGGSGQATTGPAGLPRPLYVKFVHTRSDDPGKTVTIHLPKAYSMALTYPFTREDIAVMDLDFSAIVDRDCVTTGTTKAPTIVAIEATA